MLDNIMNIFGV